MTDMHLASLWRQALQKGLREDGALLVVDSRAQQLYLLRNGSVEKTYTVSTSKNGLGNQENSLKTPTGWHEVIERYGDGEPLGRAFVDREPTDLVLPEETWRDDDHRDLILTRILRLTGLEEGVNRGGSLDTYARYIYFHGANHEHRLGTPASHGCIHLSNHEIVDLFDRTRGVRTWCWIE